MQSPTDVDAEESSFENQFNGLVAGSGVTLTQFSGFAPATTAQTTPAPTTGSTSSTPAGVVAVPTTLAVTGNYGQINTFINDLDGFPRLFVIQTFVLTYGAASSAPVRPRRAPAPRPSASASGITAVDRRNGHARRGGPVLAGHRRIDLLHLDTERPRRLHQGHGRRPLSEVPDDRLELQLDPADLHVADGQGLAGGDPGQPFDVGAHRHQ